jgi:prolipoprotein diacylglyceryltransferase
MIHALFESLAYAVGFAVYRWRRNRRGDALPDPRRWTVIAAAAVGAVVGSKVLFWIEDPLRTAASWRDPAYLIGGKTIVGGLIGGLIAVEAVKWLVGERRSTGDLFAVPLCVGIAVGRIGRWLAGPGDQTWGRPTAGLLGVDGGDGVPRHCLPLYEIAFVAALGVVLARFERRGPRSGDVFGAFMAGYFAFRLGIEWLKDAPRFAGLSAIQWASAATLVYYAALWQRRARAGRALSTSA